MIMQFMQQHAQAILITNCIITLLVGLLTWNAMIYMHPSGYWAHCDKVTVVRCSVFGAIFWLPILVIIVIFWSAILSWWIWKQIEYGFIWLANYCDTNQKDGSNG